MSQEDEKCEQQQEPEPQELPDRDVIVRLSERFEIFTRQVLSKMDELLSMRDTVEKLLQRKSVKRQQDAERKKRETDNNAFTGLFGGKARAQGVPS